LIFDSDVISSSLIWQLIPLKQPNQKLLHPKGMEFRSEICVSTELNPMNLDGRDRKTKEQLTVLIAANTEAEHTDFPLCNSFFDRFHQNRTFQVNP
jgi:hypothetical protein